MGVDIEGFIEYDIRQVYYPEKLKYGFASPFSQPGTQYIDSVSNEPLNLGVRRYDFFAAIAGVRNETGIPPLYTPRGLPEDTSYPVKKMIRDELYDPGNATGWLTLDEIRRALQHHSVTDAQLNSNILLAFDIMSAAEARFGVGWVRFVFMFDSM